MREDDMKELEKYGKDISPASLHIMALVLDNGLNPRLRRTFLRGIVDMYRRTGVLGEYLEHEPPGDTVWSRFRTMISDTANEMARERRA